MDVMNSMMERISRRVQMRKRYREMNTMMFYDSRSKKRSMV